MPVVLLAFVVLQGARRFGVGRGGGPLELVGRLPIDARRAVYLVRLGETVYVSVPGVGRVSAGTHAMAIAIDAAPAST